MESWILTIWCLVTGGFILLTLRWSTAVTKAMNQLNQQDKALADAMLLQNHAIEATFEKVEKLEALTKETKNVSS